VTLTNRQRKQPVDLKELSAFLQRLPRLPAARVRRVHVALVSDRVIAALNRRHLGRCGATDVLAFRLSRASGELVISAETASRNAAAYGRPLMDELALLVVHGLLHLCGFDDSTGAKRRLMQRKQNTVMAAIRRGA